MLAGVKLDREEIKRDEIDRKSIEHEERAREHLGGAELHRTLSDREGIACEYAEIMRLTEIIRARM